MMLLTQRQEAQKYTYACCLLPVFWSAVATPWK